MNAEAGMKGRVWIVFAALLALFLCALDTLVMTAAMPTVIAELGGLDLYAWSYSSYFFARAVSLPVFGKLSDLFPTKNLTLFSIGLFVVGSVAAGASPSMGFLVAARLIQGVGAGGVFALVYVVLSDVSKPGERAKTLSYAGSIWGIASLIGPTLGGFIVTWFSWRWIFYINLPLGLISMVWISRHFKEFRKKPDQIHLDWQGAVLLCVTILGLLFVIMNTGGHSDWNRLFYWGLIVATFVCGGLFYRVEQKSLSPILDLSFFKVPGFSFGNAIVFCASFSVFSLFAYTPLFLQSILGQTPLQIGYVMLSLSLGWSLGSFLIGRVIHHTGQKSAAVIGGLLMVSGSSVTLLFSQDTTMTHCFFVFMVIGLGMGFVTLSTLIIVQDSLKLRDLGVATSFHQFARSFGGTIGVSVCGGLLTARLMKGLQTAGGLIPETMLSNIQGNLENLFKEEVQALIPGGIEAVFKSALLESVFFVVLLASVIGMILTVILPGQSSTRHL